MCIVQLASDAIAYLIILDGSEISLLGVLCFNNSLDILSPAQSLETNGQFLFGHFCLNFNDDKVIKLRSFVTLLRIHFLQIQSIFQWGKSLEDLNLNTQDIPAESCISVLLVLDQLISDSTTDTLVSMLVMLNIPHMNPYTFRQENISRVLINIATEFKKLITYNQGSHYE